MSSPDIYRSDTDSDNTSTSSLSSENGKNDNTPTISTWYNVAMDPVYTDMSDHSSDGELYDEPEEQNLDTELRDISEWCSCGECKMIQGAGIELFCCSDISKVEEMKGIVNALP